MRDVAGGVAVAMAVYRTCGGPDGRTSATEGRRIGEAVTLVEARRADIDPELAAALDGYRRQLEGVAEAAFDPEIGSAPAPAAAADAPAAARGKRKSAA